MSEDLYARLYPFSPRRGIFVRTYTMDGQVYKGGERPTWYRITPDLAALMQDKHQQFDDLDSKPLFQIVEHTKKIEIEAREQEQFLAALGAVGQTYSTARDVAPPPTVDVKVDNLFGRASALPPPRTNLQQSNAAGTITASDAQRGRGAVLDNDTRVDNPE